MTLSSFALILGTACYVFGLPVIFADEAFLAWRRRIVADPQSLRLAGMILTAVAVTTLRYHWRVSWDGEGAMILLAWLTLGKGLFLAWWPARAVNAAAWVDQRITSAQALTFAGCIAVLLGAALTSLGFVLA